MHVVEEAGGSATGGDDGVVVVGGGVQQFLLQFAESLLAIAFEEDGDGGVEEGFKRLVEVEPLVAETDGQFVPDGGLATVHVAYEVDAHGSLFLWGRQGAAGEGDR